MATSTYSTTPEQRKVITDYAELVALAFTTAKQEAGDLNVAENVAAQVASMLVPPTLQEYAQVLAARPRIQMAPNKLMVS